MKIVTLSAVALIAFASPALALQTCTPTKKDARVCTAPYDPDQVLRVWGTLRSMTVFVFGKDETNPRFFAANKNDLTFKVDGNMIAFKPKPTPIAWHVQPIAMFTTLPDGSVRRYLIEYDLQDGGPLTEPKLDPNAKESQTQFEIVYTYPQDEAAKARQVAEARAAKWRETRAERMLAKPAISRATGTPGMNCRYTLQYDVKNPPPFVPPRVCDDGQATYLSFPGNMNVPAITIDGPDGKPMVPMQNFDAAQQQQVVHQLAHHFYLRIGQALVCVWRDDAVDAIGTNPGTDTSNPMVRRVLKETAR